MVLRLVGAAVAALFVLGGCRSSPPKTGECSSNRDCSAGQVCTPEHRCATLCDDDGQCAAGQICTDDTCVAGTRSAPEIGSIDGDDPSRVCPDAGGTHCVASGIAVGGNNLVGASFELRPESGAAIALSPAPGSTATLARLALPAAIPPGTYTLAVANQAGTATQTFTLIQGPAGPAGPDKTPDELVDAVNAATRGIAIERLPIGTGPGTVAPGDHVHALAGITGLEDALVAHTTDSFAAIWVNGITYDPETDALFYIQWEPWSVSRYDIATRRSTLVWCDTGGNYGDGVAVVTRPSGREVWFGSAGWAWIRHVPVGPPADASINGGQATDYSFAPGGFSGLVEAEPFSTYPNTYISVQPGATDLRYWVFGTNGYSSLQLGDRSGGETIDMNAAAASSLIDDRNGSVGPGGLYLDEPTHTVWVGDRNHGMIWIFRYDPAVLSTKPPNLPLLTFLGRVRTTTWESRGLAYDRARKLLWTCNHAQNRCDSARFDIDAFVTSFSP